VTRPAITMSRGFDTCVDSYGEGVAKPAYQYRHQRARAALLADDPCCAHCGRRIATVADHEPALTLHRHVPDSGCCYLVPSCRPCSDRQGGRLSRRGRLAPWQGNSVQW